MPSISRDKRAQLFERLAMLPAQLSGRLSDPTGTVERLWKAVGIEALAVIQEAFLVKSQGGTDEAGITWDPLTPEYIAYQRRHPGLNKRRSYATRAGRERRPLLSAQQDQQWRAIFAREVTRQRGAGIDAKEAAANAAALAWSVIKRAGGQTILGRHGSTSVEIGRDTGRLFNSLSPASPSNILEVRGPGQVAVGSNVAYAGHFHAKRPLWPDELPDTWKERLAKTMEDGVQEVTRRLLEGIVNG